jgi:hypothetical protein
LGLTSDQKKEFATKVSGYATACGAEPVGVVDGVRDAHYIFKMSG